MLRFLFILIFCIISVDVQAASVRNFRERTEMNFATIIADPDGDVIRLRPNNRITARNGSLFLGSPSAAKFTVRGDPDEAVFISFSSGDTLTGAGAPMRLRNFQHNKGSSPSFNARGRLTFKVGARLVIGAGQVSGSYSGTYLVTVDYP